MALYFSSLSDFVMTATNDIQKIEEFIVAAKENGLSDREVGDKFDVNFQAIERAITKLTGVNVSVPHRQKKIRNLAPKKFSPETTTVWSFRSRGNWATHNGNYRGNWSPYIPRNVLTKYSREGQLVLDCFCGSGATAVECKLLNRDFIGVDINPHAIELARENIDFSVNASLFEEKIEPKINLEVGDARSLSFIQDKSVDLICAHPPYADIIQYTDNHNQDLSFFEIDSFLDEMSKVAKENFRVLKDDGYCAILIGDMRKNKNVIPLGFRLIDVYLENGFVLKELIIKRQHNCRTTGFWYKNSIKYNFLLLAHEYLAIFKKNTHPTLSKISADRSVENSIQKSIKSEKLETTTVWIFQHDNWYENTIRNLIERYDGKDHIIIDRKGVLKNTHTLIIWNLSKEKMLKADISDFKKITNHIRDEGYLAILCKDVRLENGMIYPTAIHITKEFDKINSVRIKEIVVLSLENGKSSMNNDDLDIIHKYMIIYQKMPEIAA